MKKDLQNTGIGFNGIVGQEVPVRVLNHLLASDRLPGTLLFSGPGGVGKYATALTLAKILHCDRVVTGYCDCRSCTAIRTGSHPDVLVISRERTVGVEEMREIVALACLKSSRGQERLIIFDRAENITVQAANAALKTLEEPGAHIRFVLVTDTPEALLPTVRSRSYRLRFSLVSQEKLLEFAKAAGDNPDDPDTVKAIRFASGRPGLYLRYRHSSEYRDVINSTGTWLTGILNSRSAPRIQDALDWKAEFWDYADKLSSAERTMNLPRGGDADDVRKFFESPGKYIVQPANWRIEGKASSEKRWGQGRKAMLLTGLLRRILSMEMNRKSVSAISRLYDFMEKLRYNCSFDIALERLYYGLTGITG